MTQQEYFKKAHTDELLKMRYGKSCYHPHNEGDKPDFGGAYSGDADMWYIDKTLLYSELAKRPHRVRAKDRRKKKRE